MSVIFHALFEKYGPSLTFEQAAGDLYSQVEIIPASGFRFDQLTGSFKGELALEKPAIPKIDKSPKLSLKAHLDNLNSLTVSPMKHEI